MKALTSLFTALLTTALMLFAGGAAADGAEQELIKIENAWNDALIKRDGAFLKQLYADEYTYTDSTGKVFDKKTDIADSVSGKWQIDSARHGDVKVRVYGDVAVVTGLNTLAGRYEGADISGPRRFTDVFLKRDGRWQVVASQTTKVGKN